MWADEEDDIMAHFSGSPPPPKAPPVKSVNEKLKHAFSTLTMFPEGVIALRHIMNECGWDAPLKTYHPKTSELNVHATLYNLSHRDVWLTLRELLTPQQKALIETEDQPWVKEDRQKALLEETRQRLSDLL